MEGRDKFEKFYLSCWQVQPIDPHVRQLCAIYTILRLCNGNINYCLCRRNLEKVI